MIKFLFLMKMVASTLEQNPIDDQIVFFKNNTQGPVGLMTTSSGAPIESRDAGSTLNTNLLTNEYVIESMAHLARERIPARMVHPKGSGAFGYFITTRDISDKCKAKFMNGIGKITPVAARLSMGITERGGTDLVREPRGFSIKFYTEEGNFDIVGFNTPIFAVKEPSLFVPFVHVMRKNPATDFSDPNMVWDFLTMHPETFFIFLIIFSDKGIPDGYRHMPGYGVHTYILYNECGKITYARFHFNPLGGLKNLNSTEAERLGAKDPDYSARALYKAIASGDYPTWEVSLQIMSQNDVDNATFDTFDITQIIPESQFPLYPIGKLVLNRSPQNYFAEVEQMSFSPSNLVPGILGSPDKTFEARRFSYKDSQRYRLGSNFNKIKVNYPYRSKTLTYNRDGLPPVSDNEYDIPNYYPNSFNGPIPYTDENRPSLPKIYEAAANNFKQVRDYYINQIAFEEKSRLVENIVTSLCPTANFLQDRAVKIFKKIHFDLADRVTKALKKNNCKH